MALVEIRQLDAHTTRMGLWRMDESTEELYRLYPHLEALPMSYRSESRQKEYLCIRVLLSVMTGRQDLLIDHLPSGKPVVDGFNISISHTRGYAALVLSRSEAVAVDIEYRSDRVGRIVHKFLLPEETSALVGRTDDSLLSTECPDRPMPTTDDLLLAWSAKETLYKLHSSDRLDYFEMRCLQKDGSRIVLENIKRGKVVSIPYKFTDDYVLTWAVEAVSAAE